MPRMAPVPPSTLPKLVNVSPPLTSTHLTTSATLLPCHPRRYGRASRRYEEAWAALHTGNSLQDDPAAYSPEHESATTDAIIDMFRVRCGCCGGIGIGAGGGGEDRGGEAGAHGWLLQLAQAPACLPAPGPCRGSYSLRPFPACLPPRALGG